MSSKIIPVHIWSDITCCWCYIGKAILKQAINIFNKRHQDVKVDIIFHSYMISHQANEGGEDFMEYNKRTWNGDQQWIQELKEKGKKYGCNFSNWIYWPNSHLCHKLISESKKVGKCNEIVEELFISEYEHGKNISIESTLNNIAKQYGINNWNTEENFKIAKNDDQIGKKKYGIKSVPFFLFPNDEVVDNSGDIETFLNALEKAFDSL